MEKFIVLANSKKINYPDEKLYNKINEISKNKKDIKNVDHWYDISREWNIVKYNENNKRICDCNMRLISIGNENVNINICEDCIKYFNHLISLKDNINEIIIGIMKDVVEYKPIHYNLRVLLGIDNSIIEKYNEKGKKNKKTKNIYDMLIKIGEYSDLKNDYLNKLKQIYYKIDKNIYDKEILEKIEDIKSKIKICNNCDYLKQCKECFYRNNMNLDNISSEQIDALCETSERIFNEKNLMAGLYGYAGAGKTTCIRYILQINNLRDMFILKELVDIFELDLKNMDIEKIRKIVKNKLDDFSGKREMNGLISDILNGLKIVILASPTNKALDVIREKISKIKGFKLIDSVRGYYNNIEIRFNTVSKLLSYKRYLDFKHNVEFKRGYKYKNIMDVYNLIIIDEASMLGKMTINDIKSDIKYRRQFVKNYSRGYVVFVGDKAQLPPVKEKYSEVFKLKMNSVELKKIMRTDRDNIKDICNLIRSWLKKDIKDIRYKLISYGCDYINYYTNKSEFIDDSCNNSDGIILVWTNKTRMEYNKKIRKLMFKERCSEKYVENERLIFNNFYRLKTKDDEKKFYSSMTVSINKLKILEKYICEKYVTNVIINEIDEKIKKDKKLKERIDNDTYYDIKEAIKKFVDKFNESMKRDYKVWEIFITYKKEIIDYPMYVIYDKKYYDKEIDSGRRHIREYFETEGTLDEDILNIIREIVIELFDKYYEQPFADVDYGYSITTDKSQGSTFESVYVDSPDILDLSKYPYLDLDTAKRRFYTAITRASEKVNIYI